MATLDDIEAAFAAAGAALPERMARSLGNRYFLKDSDLSQIGYICFFFRETPLRGILPNRPSLLGQRATPKTVHKHMSMTHHARRSCATATVLVV